MDSKIRALPTHSPKCGGGHFPAAHVSGHLCLGSQAQVSWLLSETGDLRLVHLSTSSPLLSPGFLGAWGILGSFQSSSASCVYPSKPSARSGDASPGSITAQGPSQPLPQKTEAVYPVGWLSSSFLCGSLSRDHLWGYLSTLILSMTPVSSLPPFLHEERSMAGAVIPTSSSGLGPPLLKRVTILTPMGEGWDLDEIPHIKNLLPPCLRAPAPPFTPPPLAPVWWPQNTHLSHTEPQTLQGSLAVLPGGKLGA